MSQPNQYMVMSDHNGRTCLRVEVGQKFTSYISHEKRDVNLRRLTNAEFDRRFVWEWHEQTPEGFAAAMFRLPNLGVIVTRRARAHLTLFHKEPVMAAPTPVKTAAAEAAKPKANPAPKPAADPKEPKAPKAEGEATTRGKRIENRKIKVLVKDNPKRPSSASFQRFELYKTCKTTDEFLAAGGYSADLRYDVEHEFIELY